jgi:5-methylcytosine-specific restriction protein A
MPFVVGETYTRNRIHAELGGETVTFLPQKGGRIVCGCFSTEPNPEAPYVILVGGAEDDEVANAILRKANILLEQGGFIPVFLKHGPNAWAFDGHYRVQGHTRDPEVIRSKQAAAERDDVVLVIYLEPTEPPRHAYLLTWNPGKWRWDDLEAMARQTAQGRPVIERWSCGRRRNIDVGDRLFLLRQGVEPRGIIGAGFALGTPYEALHWDDERRERGEMALRVDVRFERILNPDLDDPLPPSVLRSGRLAGVNWSTQISGIEIGEAVEDLERLWAEHLQLYTWEQDEFALEGELRVALVRHRARERLLRDAKIDQYWHAHAGRLPCEVCGFDFVEGYGEIGRGYAQVHHREPLGCRTRPSETRLTDLAVVCANCHAMIHRGGNARSLESLMASARPGGVP